MGQDNSEINRLAALIQSIPDLPNWVGRIVDCPAELAKQGIVEASVVTTSYLDFLREQIALCARGRDWNRVLSLRLKNLQPFEHQQLLLLTINGDAGKVFYVRTSPDAKQLIHWEAH